MNILLNIKLKITSLRHNCSYLPLIKAKNIRADSHEIKEVNFYE